jgi:hypothetical protein
VNSKVLGAVLGAVGLFLWFQPFRMLGGGFWQSGQHIGGIAYLLLFAMAVYAVLSWMELHVPRMIAAGLALAILLVILLSAGAAAAWALYALIVLNVASMALAWRDEKKGRRSVAT